MNLRDFFQVTDHAWVENSSGASGLVLRFTDKLALGLYQAWTPDKRPVAYAQWLCPHCGCTLDQDGDTEGSVCEAACTGESLPFSFELTYMLKGPDGDVYAALIEEGLDAYGLNGLEAVLVSHTVALTCKILAEEVLAIQASLVSFQAASIQAIRLHQEEIASGARLIEAKLSLDQANPAV